MTSSPEARRSGHAGRSSTTAPAECSQCGTTPLDAGHVHWLVLYPLCTGERFAFCGVACLRDHAEEMMGD